MNNQIITENLKRIRNGKQISQESIAKRAGLSRSAYRNIENGKSLARVKTLRSIASALEVQLQDLLIQIIPLRKVRFRSTKKLRTRQQILANVSRWLENYNKLENILNNHQPYVFKGFITRLENNKQIKQAAFLARQELGLSSSEPIYDICGLLNSSGIKVFPIHIASDGFFGLAVAESEGGPAIVINIWKRNSVERRIFSAAHELGHLLLHLDDFNVDALTENKVHETEANTFAAHFLMPEEIFWSKWNETYGLGLLDRVIKIKRIFRVSYRTILSRLAPTYSGWGNIWVRFQTEYKKQHGRTLTKYDEPDGLPEEEISETMRSREPNHLSDADFKESRLPRLVRQAINANEISMTRAAEFLGLSLLEMRECANS